MRFPGGANMSSTGLKIVDETLQKTNVWLKEIEQVCGPDRQRAYQVCEWCCIVYAIV
jgi:hypothetical protein